MKKAIEFLDYYRSEMGDRKFRKLIKEVDTANRFNQLMKDSKDQMLLPGTSDFYACILHSVKYTFAGKEKLLAVAFLLLERWNKEINMKYNLKSPEQLDQFVELLIMESSQLGV